MFARENGIFDFEPTNENKKKLLNYIKRKNGFVGWRRFNAFKDNHDGTVTLFLNDGLETRISAGRLSEVLKAGKVVASSSRSNKYLRISFEGGTFGFHRFLMRDELEKYEGFMEETGLPIQVNHIDEDTLNNTDENLEVVTEQENKLKSRLIHSRGYWETPNGNFQVKVQGKVIGTFETEEEAREAYVQAVKAELKRFEELRINWLESKGRL